MQKEQQLDSVLIKVLNEAQKDTLSIPFFKEIVEELGSEYFIRFTLVNKNKTKKEMEREFALVLYVQYRGITISKVEHHFHEQALYPSTIINVLPSMLFKSLVDNAVIKLSKELVKDLIVNLSKIKASGNY